MVDRVIERTETEVPRETRVVHDDHHGSNVGTIIAVVLGIILLLWLFGGGLF